MGNGFRRRNGLKKPSPSSSTAAVGVPLAAPTEIAPKNWRTKGDLSIILLDPRHVFIKLSNKEDMHQKTKRSFWLRDWCLGFSAGAMISVSAMVIQCMRLFGYRDPICLLSSSLSFACFLSSLLSELAWPGPTKLVSRPNVARVCVEVDLLKENLPNRVWIGSTVYGSLAINRFFLNT